MPAFRFRRQDEPAVDPFNAGDPVLPWDDPDALADEGDVFDDRPSRWSDGPSDVEYAPHGEPGGQPHKQEDDYRAPTTRDHDYDAPSIDDAPRRGRWRPRRAASGGAGDAEPDRHAGRSRLGGLIATVVIILIAINVAVPVISLVGEFVDDAASSVSLGADSTNEDESSLAYGGDDAEEGAIELAASAALSGATADPESGALHGTLVEYLDEKLLTIEGYSAAELGIDADAFATWVISSTSFSADGAYDRGDGTAVAYADFAAPYVNGIFWDFDEAISDYLVENDLWGTYAGSSARELTDEQRAHVSGVFEEVLESAEISESPSWPIDLVSEGESWVVDADSLAETFTSLYGLW